MKTQTMKVLDHQQILRKVKRLAIQILEHNYAEEQIYLIGINNNGLSFAQLLHDEIKRRSKQVVQLLNVTLDPSDPISSPISINSPIETLQNQVLILVDDVANSGRTLFYSAKPFLEIIPKKLEVAVLVDRTHKRFPIGADYIGLSLATTTFNNIRVSLTDKQDFSVYLE